MSCSRVPSVVENVEFSNGADIARRTEDWKWPLFNDDAVLCSDVVIKVRVEHSSFHASNLFYV